MRFCLSLDETAVKMPGTSYEAPVSSSAKSVWVASCRSRLLLMPGPFLCIYIHCIMPLSTGKSPCAGLRTSQLLNQGTSQKSAYVHFVICFITSSKQAQSFSRIKNELTHMTKSVSIKHRWWDHSLFAPSGRSQRVCHAILLKLNLFFFFLLLHARVFC